MEDLVSNFSKVELRESEKKEYLLRWKKIILRRIFGSIPMMIVLAVVSFIVIKNIYYCVDNIFINVMCLAIFLGLEIYSIIIFSKEIYGYIKFKDKSWYQSIMYIDVTSSGKIEGTYYKENGLYSGIIKYNYGELLRDLRMQYATLISFDGSSKLLVLNKVDWCKEVARINQPRIKN